MQHMGDVKGWIGGEAQPKREGKKVRSVQPKGKKARGSDRSLVLEQPSECEIVFALIVPGEHKHYVEKSPYTQSNNWWTRNYTFVSLCAVSAICSTNFLSTGFAA